STMRFHRDACSSAYMPAQPDVMRACGETHTISVNTRPAPPSARAPMWTMWNSPGVPSRDRYISIGATAMRLTSVIPRREYGVNIGGGGTSAAVGCGSDAASLALAANQRSTPERYLA